MTSVEGMTDDELATAWNAAERDEKGGMKDAALEGEFWKRLQDANPAYSPIWYAHNIVTGEDGVERCLACDSGDHHSCYGTHCDCECEGNEVS